MEDSKYDDMKLKCTGRRKQKLASRAEHVFVQGKDSAEGQYISTLERRINDLY